MDAQCLDVRGPVCKAAGNMVSKLPGATNAALRTDLDHFLRSELAMAWTGDVQRLAYLLLLLVRHGGGNCPAVAPR